jgi:hypothetical protein
MMASLSASDKQSADNEKTTLCLNTGLRQWDLGFTPECREKVNTNNARQGWLDGWMVGWLDGWMVGWVDGWMVGWLDGWMVGWLDVWIVGLLDCWIVGLLDCCLFGC